MEYFPQGFFVIKIIFLIIYSITFFIIFATTIIYIKMTHLEDKIKEYWTERSNSYSEAINEDLADKHAQQWEELLYQQFDKNAHLKVLDIGTGPGMFAILMGKNPNYEVFAVDSSKGMLEQATQNAKNFGVNVNFQFADAHHLPFDDESFDVIITRNVTWNLPYPKEAYKEWKRVLKKGGKMVNFDSNWYLRLYNGDLQKDYNKSTDEEFHQEIPDGMPARMEAIARELPLSSERRPAWDVNCLLELGFSKMSFDYNINEFIYNTEEQEHYTYAPMFMIKATK